jgi:hypothetical protein
VLVGRRDGRSHLEDLSIDGKIILKTHIEEVG